MIAQDEDSREKLAQLVMEEVCSLWGELAEAESGDAAEARVLAWSRKLGRQVLAAGLQARVEAAQRQADRRCACGGRKQLHSHRLRVVVTMLGPVRVRRQYLHCPNCGVRQFPADGWLRWKGDFSWRVQEAVAWECSAVPYREAQKSLSKLAGIELSVDAAETIARQWGEDELTPSPYQDRVEKDLVIEVDGAKAHLEDGWREIKVGACFSWDCDHPDKDPEAVSYTADWESAEQFRDTLWQEAVARGVTTARSVAVIGDGAPWIWEMVSHIFPRATQILDWYHLTEHLWTAAKVVHGEGTPETAALVKQWKTEVCEGRSEGVEEHLLELLAAGKDDKSNALRKCADYLQTHQARLRYHLFRADGWPIGSGVVEGACKHVVGLRFKRQSTRWTRAGARAVLHLRLDRLSGRWQQRYDHIYRQLPRAA
jgi:hypothetical protein